MLFNNKLDPNVKLDFVLTMNTALRKYFKYSRYQIWSIFLGCLMIYSSTSHAQRWSAHTSEAEAQDIIYSLFEQLELPSHKVRRGSYLLLSTVVKKDQAEYFPLISAPCPLLSDCESLIAQLRTRLIQRGYQLVYSAQKSRSQRPLYFAVAKGNQPVLALRLFPGSSLATIIVSLQAKRQIGLKELKKVSPHITFILSEEITSTSPQIKLWLEQTKREYLVSLDHLTLHRALIDSSTGNPLSDFHKRKLALNQVLSSLIQNTPSSIGLYISSLTKSTLDRALLDELMTFSAKNRLYLLFEKTDDDIPLAVARSFGVRSLEVIHSDQNQTLKEYLKSLEANLVLDGTISTIIAPKLADWSDFITWLKKLEESDVSFLRTSETAF